MADLIQPPHPFYPLEANIVGYLANEWSVTALVGVFFTACVLVLASTQLLLHLCNPQLPGKEKAIVLWFVLCM